MDFIYDANPSRVIFAAGARSTTGEELDRLGVSRIMVITTPPQAHIAAEFARLIGARAGIVYPGAQVNTPTNVTEAALTAVSSVKADGILAIGSGTAIGLSKAIAWRTDLPQLVLPTTFGGSEMTAALVETERGARTIQRSRQILPETVIYDPDLVSTLPTSIAGPSAMNALAHSLEALYAKDGNPATSLMAEESIRALGNALPRILADARDKEAWTQALYGSWLAAACLGSVSMAVHHRICHTLGGIFDLADADIHCVLLPYTIAFNSKMAPEAMSRAGRALGSDDAASALYDLMLKAASQTSLKEMGLTRAALEKVADIAVNPACDNPRPVTRDSLLEILTAAYEGERP
jgi:alcohol dehydrogenase class IV